MPERIRDNQLKKRKFTAPLATISNQCDTIMLMLEAADWGKDLRECFVQIEKNVNQIRTQVEFIRLEVEED